jgi:regulator of RNase E activity RraA
VRPLDEHAVLVGRARTGLYMSRFAVAPGENPYAVEIALVDDLRPGDVAVLACGGPTDRIAPWGELLSTAAVARGAAGCVTDGLVRDILRIRAMGFAVFHGGIGPLDSKGRAKMMERDLPVEVAGVRVESGDWIFGDADGVVVVPRLAAAEVFTRALTKVEAEDATRAALAAGRPLGEVFAEHGVL